MRAWLRWGSEIIISVAFAIIIPLTAFLIHEEWLFQHTAKHTVMLLNSSGGGGTGFHFEGTSGSNYIMSNAHVCGKNVRMLVPGRGEAVVLERDLKHDLCVLKPLYPHTGGLTFASWVYPNERVRVLGHGYLLPLQDSLGRLLSRVFIWLPSESPPPCRPNQKAYQTLFFGAVCMDLFDAVFTSLKINPGNSGSPAVDIFGNVVGVVFAGHSASKLGYLVPLEYVLEMQKGR